MLNVGINTDRDKIKGNLLSAVSLQYQQYEWYFTKAVLQGHILSSLKNVGIICIIFYRKKNKYMVCLLIRIIIINLRCKLFLTFSEFFT
jgi:hypothetical protein